MPLDWVWRVKLAAFSMATVKAVVESSSAEGWPPAWQAIS